MALPEVSEQDRLMAAIAHGSAVILLIGIVTCGIGTFLLFPFFFVEAWYAWRAYQGDWAGYPMLGAPPEGRSE